MLQSSVSAIVCAYNEEKTVRPVLETLLVHPGITEVVAVDDHSTDHTTETLESIHNKKLVVVTHEKNLGKGAGMAHAIRMAHGDIVLFADADLIGFTVGHINRLLNPVFRNPTVMSIGKRASGSIFEKHFGCILKSFGGERAICRKRLLPIVEYLKTSGYGAETLINRIHLKQAGSVQYVALPGLQHISKNRKHRWASLLRTYMKENIDVLRALLARLTVPL